MSALRELLTLAVSREASDVHIKPGHPAVLRVHQQLVDVELPPLTVDQVASAFTVYPSLSGSLSEAARQLHAFSD